MSESVDSLKQRLVGAFVILSLAVIFLPMLFDKPHRERAAELELVPPKPELERVIISKPSKNQITNDSIASPGEPSENDSAEGAAKDTPKDAKPLTPQLVSVQKPLLDDSSKTKVVVSEDRVQKPKPQKKQASTPKVYSNVWMVQLGTFSKSANAYALRDKVRAKGIGGHTKQVDSGKSLRVFAGPFVTKKEALRIKRKLDSEFKIQSLVVFFEA